MGAPYVPPPGSPATIPPMQSMVPPRRRSPMGIVALVALVVLCGVAATVLAVMNFGEEPRTDQAEAAEGPTRIAAVPVAEPSRTTRPNEPLIAPLVTDDSDQVSVKIETTPPGADVFRSGELVGVTPIDAFFDRGDTESWQIFLDGYEVEELSVSLDADFQSAIVLKKLAPENTSATSSRPASSTTTATSGTPTKAAGGSTTSTSGTSGSSRKKDDRKKDVPQDSGGRTVIKGSTGAVLPD